MGRLILIVLSSLYLELIIFVFLLLLIFLRLRLRLWLFLLFLFVLFILVFALILPLELILGPSEALIHLLYALCHLSCLFFVDGWLEIFFDHLRILNPFVH